MELDKLSGKLVKWALLHQEYDVEVVYRAGASNLHANGFFHNPNLLEKNLPQQDGMHVVIERFL